ncbi:MAG: hypothetical protein AAF707_06985 [Pseudomonadota bacterium]
MADTDLSRMERVSKLRRRADELRLMRTRRALDKAVLLREAAEQRSQAQAAMERALIIECYEAPDSEQAWIAHEHRVGQARDASQQAQKRCEEETTLADQRAAEARVVLGDDARLTAIHARLEASRRIAEARSEEAAAEENLDVWQGACER